MPKLLQHNIYFPQSRLLYFSFMTTMVCLEGHSTNSQSAMPAVLLGASYVTILWPSTPPHAILKFCQHHLFQTHYTIVSSVPRNKIWNFVNTACYRSIVPAVQAPRAGGLENAAIFGDLSTNNPNCHPTWDKSWYSTKEKGWKPAPSRHRMIASQFFWNSVESWGWRGPKCPKNVINRKFDPTREKSSHSFELWYELIVAPVRSNLGLKKYHPSPWHAQLPRNVATQFSTLYHVFGLSEYPPRRANFQQQICSLKAAWSQLSFGKRISF